MTYNYIHTLLYIRDAFPRPVWYGQFDSQIAPRVGQFELIQFQIPDISHLSPYGGGGGGGGDGVDIDRCISEEELDCFNMSFNFIMYVLIQPLYNFGNLRPVRHLEGTS